MLKKVGLVRQFVGYTLYMWKLEHFTIPASRRAAKLHLYWIASWIARNS